MTAAMAGQSRVQGDPDQWWDSLPPDRKRQIHRWVGQADQSATEVTCPGQLSLADALDPDAHTSPHATSRHPSLHAVRKDPASDV